MTRSSTGTPPTEVHVQALGGAGIEAVADWLVRKGRYVTAADVAAWHRRWSNGLEPEGETERLAAQWFVADNIAELVIGAEPDVKPRPKDGVVLPVNGTTLRALGMRPVRFLDDPRGWISAKLTGRSVFVPRSR